MAASTYLWIGRQSDDCIDPKAIVLLGLDVDDALFSMEMAFIGKRRVSVMMFGQEWAGHPEDPDKPIWAWPMAAPLYDALYKALAKHGMGNELTLGCARVLVDYWRGLRESHNYCYGFFVGN